MQSRYSSKRRSSTHVYVLSMRRGEDVLATKVGMSNDPEGRLKTLSSCQPFPLQLDFVSMPKGGDHARFVERRAHQSLGEFRLSSEWFSVSPGTAISAVEEALSAKFKKKPKPKRPAYWDMPLHDLEVEDDGVPF